MHIRYNKTIKDRIISLLDEDTHYTVSAICSIIGISRKTFYKWKKNIPEFADELKECTNRHHEIMMDSVRAAIKKKLEGYHTTEVRTKYVQNENNEWVAKEKVVIDRECPPDYRMIKMMIEHDNIHKGDTEQAEMAPLQIIVPEEKDAIDLENFYHKIVGEGSNFPLSGKSSTQKRLSSFHKGKLYYQLE